MESLLEQIFLNDKELFHAYLIKGDKQSALEILFKGLKEKYNFDNKGNPDFLLINEELVSVEEAREVKDFISQKSFSDEGYKITIVSGEEITNEAQNALLKSLEEPPIRNIIFIIVPINANILPTILSRVITIKHFSEEENKNAKTFLKSSIPSRLTKVTSIMKDKDIRKVRNFVFALEKVLSEEKELENKDKAYDAILHAEKELSMRGAQGKVILDYLSVVLPVMK